MAIEDTSPNLSLSLKDEQVACKDPIQRSIMKATSYFLFDMFIDDPVPSNKTALESTQAARRKVYLHKIEIL